MMAMSSRTTLRRGTWPRCAGSTAVTSSSEPGSPGAAESCTCCVRPACRYHGTCPSRTGESMESFGYVDEIVARTQSSARTPSLIAAVVRGGAVVHVAGAGDTPVPDRDTQYRIGSISKSLTAAAVLGLRDEGHLRTDDRLGDFLSGVDPTVGALRLRQLLAHV